MFRTATKKSIQWITSSTGLRSFRTGPKTIEKEIVIGSKIERVEDVVYADVYNSDWFKEAEQNVRDEWGNCNIITIIFGMDATELSSHGHQKATPMYVTTGNIDSSILRKHNGYELAGYCPVSGVSKATMRNALQRNNITSESNQNDCMVLHQRWLEQQFFHDMLEPIRR